MNEMTEKEAREILQDFKNPGMYLGASGGSMNEYYEAKGLLRGLEQGRSEILNSPEVVGMREAATRLNSHLTFVHKGTVLQGLSAAEKLNDELTKSLAAFDALKERLAP